ncbi:BrnA antitoxin family protein [Phenylobacterium sp.]|uniref:BrnA antitoxin family protein n=1 Tax=Phenylobacterium sp. TaxID=1871053 RepID=UPI00301D9AF7
MKPKYDPAIHGDPPPLTDDMLGRMRPAREVHGEAFMAKVRRGRPKAEATKEPISLRLDAAVVEHLRAKGKGWQTQVNDALASLIAEGRL